MLHAAAYCGLTEELSESNFLMPIAQKYGLLSVGEVYDEEYAELKAINIDQSGSRACAMCAVAARVTAWRIIISAGLDVDRYKSCVAKYCHTTDSRLQKCGPSPLHRAAALGHTELMQTLLGAGADPEQMDVAGCAPLHACCAYGQADAVVPLLEAQADLEARDFSGATPLLRAVLAGRFGVAALLLGRGASPSTPTFSGATPLWATRALAADSEAEGCATAHAALAASGHVARVTTTPSLLRASSVS